VSQRSSKAVVIGAIVANVAIAIAKFVAAAATGSVAMFAEGIHSVVDTGDGVLLLVGVKLSERPADDLHPFGHGQEVYFWSLIVAMMIFGAGGGASIVEGIVHVLSPEPTKDFAASYVVLGIAAVFEGASLAFGTHEFLAYKRRRHRGQGFFEAIHKSKDPTIFTVVFEDSAALAGILIAFVGILLDELLGMPVFDGIASICIGVLLATVAVLLARETRGLLLGERAAPDVTGSVHAIAAEDPAIRSVGRLRTMHLGPDDVLLSIALRFCEGIDARELGRAARRIRRTISERHPEIKHVLLEAESLP
jgi:cation diffusion facilitator family transporter